MTRPDENSKRTRVEPVFGWLTEHGGPDWPTRLIELADGLKGIATPGALAARPEYEHERHVPASPRRLAWMIRNAGRLAPLHGSQWDAYRTRVIENPARDTVLAQLDHGAVPAGIDSQLVLEGSTRADCLIECEHMVIWIEGKRNDWLAYSTTWDLTRDQLARNVEAAWILAEAAGKEFALIVCHEHPLKHHEQLLIDGYRACTWSGGLPHLSEAERKLLGSRIGTVTWSSLADQWPPLDDVLAKTHLHPGDAPVVGRPSRLRATENALDAQVIPATPIVELYDTLHAKGVSRKERLRRARAFVADPASLAELFWQSVLALGDYLPNHEGFYTSRHHYAVGEKKASSTTDLALRIRDCRGLAPQAAARAGTPAATVPGVAAVTADQLACEYLDREIVATRTTGHASHGGTAVRLDLLLRNATDGVPVVAEIKRTADSNPTDPHATPSTDMDPFAALIQALACTAQLATPAQYARLSRWGRAEQSDTIDLPAPADLADLAVPLFDVYLVLHNRPSGTYLHDLGLEASRLSERLLAHPKVARHVRRIACVITRLEDAGLAAEVEWAWERTPLSTAAIEATFAEYFRPWAITLPASAVIDQLPGSLHARGWSVRWKWHDDGALEFRAAHRMTNERWHVIVPAAR